MPAECAKVFRWISMRTLNWTESYSCFVVSIQTGMKLTGRAAARGIHLGKCSAIVHWTANWSSVGSMLFGEIHESIEKTKTRFLKHCLVRPNWYAKLERQLEVLRYKFCSSFRLSQRFRLKGLSHCSVKSRLWIPGNALGCDDLESVL